MHFLIVSLALHGGESVEEQLGDIGEGEGGAAADAFAGELFDEIAEEAIHGIGFGEVSDAAEEFGGQGSGSVRIALLRMASKAHREGWPWLFEGS